MVHKRFPHFWPDPPGYVLWQYGHIHDFVGSVKEGKALLERIRGGQPPSDAEARHPDWPQYLRCVVETGRLVQECEEPPAAEASDPQRHDSYYTIVSVLWVAHTHLGLAATDEVYQQGSEELSVAAGDAGDAERQPAEGSRESSSFIQVPRGTSFISGWLLVALTELGGSFP